MTDRNLSGKSAEAYRTISEVAEDLKLPQHVLRFWETRFPQVRPLKRAGGRRFYRPEDVALLRAIKVLLYGDGYTIKGVQRMLQEQGPRSVAGGAGRSGPDYARPVEARQESGSAMRDDDLPFDPEPARSGTSASPVRPAPAGPAQAASHGRSSAGEPAAPDAAAVPGLVARLEAVAFDLSECERLLALARGPATRHGDSFR